MKKTVLCYLVWQDKVLMLYRNKKKEDINAGKWIGIGGHIEGAETPLEAVKREAFEETGLRLMDITERGIVGFYNDDVYTEKSYVYLSRSFTGDLTECDEGELSWIPIDEVPRLSLWEGDRLFLPILFTGTEGFYFKLYYKKDKLVRSEKIL